MTVTLALRHLDQHAIAPCVNYKIGQVVGNGVV